MTTKRKKSKATARTGIKYVRDIVESHNCVFQEIDLENDVGNDAYIEFIQEEDATGCCIAVQIKSGASYVSKNGDSFILKGDKEHFVYWDSHILPIGAVIYDPRNNKAAWCDVTEFLESNPKVIENGPYNISILASQEFNSSTFNEFRNQFLKYREQYKKDSNFGKALEKFARRNDFEGCLDGLRSLFSFHRQRTASWYYLISSFRNFRNHPLLRTLVIALCHIPGHDDIFWHKGNITDEPIRKTALSFMEEQFDRNDVISLLEAVDEYGFERGSIGQCIHAIVDVVKERDGILESIAFDVSIAEETRFSALLLLIYEKQFGSTSACISFIEDYLRKFPESVHKPELSELSHMIRQYGGVSFYG